MFAQLGAFLFLLIAPVLALQVVAGLAAVRGGESVGASSGLLRAASALLLPLLLAVLASLMGAMVTNDFQLLFVAQNTSAATPLFYKIVGVWGNHEGSLILWMAFIALFLIFMLRRPAEMPQRTHALALVFMGLIIAGFYLFSAFLAYPFAGNGTVPPNAGDLNELLQDVGQFIHPPLLYLGYTATAAGFALTLAILADGQLAAPWAAWLRPWALITWTLLTAGIALGSWWAYYELGWGGWWFWDPVENLALMPWLLSTALIHSLQVSAKRGQFANWSLLLTLLTFLIVLLGTFIVRSGLLSSVHAFAADPDRGLFLLALLLAWTLAAMGIYAAGTRTFQPNVAALSLNREGALLVNNLLLLTLFLAVVAGTLAPSLIAIAGGGTYKVKAGFFVPTFIYPALALLALMSLGVWTRWKRPGIANSALVGLSLALGLAMGLVLSLRSGAGFQGVVVFSLGLWLLMSTLAAWARQIGSISAIRRLQLPHQAWAIAHVGLALMVLGMGASSILKEKRFAEYLGPVSDLHAGISIGPRVWASGPNYWSIAARVEHAPSGRVGVAETRLYHTAAAQLSPDTNAEHRDFLADQGRPTSEPVIFRGLLWDTFVIIEDRVNGPPLITVSRKFGIAFIWGGAIVLVIGGLCGLAGRRRV